MYLLDQQSASVNMRSTNYLKKIGLKNQFSADFMLSLIPLLLKLSSNIGEQVGNIGSYVSYVESC